MHSNKSSMIIGLLVIAVSILLLIVYFQKQGEYTFKFMKSLYKEITVTSLRENRPRIYADFVAKIFLISN